MLTKNLIQRYKNYKKQGFLRQTERYKKKYAFVGAGGHSIDNLYPVLDFLAVPIKYIVTKSPKNAQRMAARYAGASGITDLDEALDDPEIGGVFVCTHPSLHFALAKRILEAGKTLFVEKPPCLSLRELEVLQAISSTNKTVVGLQKRYATIYQTLKKHLEKNTASSYQFRYLTGAYPEGNPWWDLFIHPLDVLVFLFGEAEVLSKQTSGGTNFVHLRHTKTGTLGSLFFSTDYSWQTPEESIEVQTSKGIYRTEQLQTLSFSPKAKSFFGIPLEKVLPVLPKTELLYHNSGFVPLRTYNPLYAHGYAGEIEAFLNLAEEGRDTSNLTGLAHIQPTFKLIEALV